MGEDRAPEVLGRPIWPLSRWRGPVGLTISLLAFVVAIALLIVGDSQADRDIFSAILSHHGYRVFTVTGELEVIKWLQNQPVGLVLMDLADPELSGYEVVDFIKNHDKLKYIPIVIVIARDPCDGAARLLENQAAVVLRQGLDKETLLDVVDKVLFR